MQELIEKVQELVDFELERANTIHPPRFNSYHEAYAVILEELEEAEAELKNARERIGWAWHHIKLDMEKVAEIGFASAEKYAIEAAAEMIQVAAMVRKARGKEDL